jgi:membrane-associated protease RseP (regulator of RpoE activity)
MQLESYEAARQREDLRLIASEVMDVNMVKHVPPEENGVIKLTGYLRVDPQAAYAYLAPRFQQSGYTALLQEEEGEQDSLVAALAMPGVIEPGRSRLWLAVLLFVLTVFSTVFVGGIESLAPFQFNLGIGMAYSASILSILFTHEMGHFLMARRLGVAVSYPFFIPLPLPFVPIGTMGAFISMKEPPPDRRALLSIAVAGPLAGLVVAIPVLILGLNLSEVRTFESFEAEVRAANEIPADEPAPIFMEGNSLLYAGLKTAVFGRFLPDGVEDVSLHPVAWAGWIGLLVTGLNLIPAGQLDGGHIFYSLMGGRIARLVTRGISFILIGFGLLWPGWLLWAALIFFLGRYRAPLRNELGPLDKRQRAIAILGLVLFILVFTPAPLTVVELGG